jgi:hypothetical protein
MHFPRTLFLDRNMPRQRCVTSRTKKKLVATSSPLLAARSSDFSFFFILAMFLQYRSTFLLFHLDEYFFLLFLLAFDVSDAIRRTMQQFSNGRQSYLSDISQSQMGPYPRVLSVVTFFFDPECCWR